MGLDVSIVTSLYDSADHLRGFLERLETCMRAVENRGLSVESVIVSNAPNRRERRLLDALLDSPWWSSHTRILFVPRESIYASWNRGVRASLGSAVAFWNVDDHRSYVAIIEGVELIRHGHGLIRFPWTCITERSRSRSKTQRVVDFQDREGQAKLDPQMDFCLGPFFMFARRVFEEYGAFDEQFHIAGDWEWQLRVTPRAGLTWGESLAGVSFADGTNLSGSGSPRLLVEQNVLFQRYSLDRPLWPLDDRAKALTASYDLAYSSDSHVAHDWVYDNHWLRSGPWRQRYLRWRRLAGTPIRLARSRMRGSG